MLQLLSFVVSQLFSLLYFGDLHGPVSASAVWRLVSIVSQLGWLMVVGGVAWWLASCLVTALDVDESRW